MNDLIASYLILSGECPLSGIGKLYISRRNAVCDLASKNILPPECHFEFKSVSVSDDEQLVPYIAQTHACTPEEASDKLSSWLDDARNRLGRHENVEIPFVGKLTKEKNGTIYLKPYTSLHNFEPVRAERVIHEADSHDVVVGDKISTSAEMNVLLNSRQKNLPGKWWIAASIILGIALLIIAFYFISDGFGLRLIPQNAPDTYIPK